MRHAAAVTLLLIGTLALGACSAATPAPPPSSSAAAEPPPAPVDTGALSAAMGTWIDDQGGGLSVVYGGASNPMDIIPPDPPEVLYAVAACVGVEGAMTLDLSVSKLEIPCNVDRLQPYGNDTMLHRDGEGYPIAVTDVPAGAHWTVGLAQFPNGTPWSKGPLTTGGFLGESLSAFRSADILSSGEIDKTGSGSSMASGFEGANRIVRFVCAGKVGEATVSIEGVGEPQEKTVLCGATPVDAETLVISGAAEGEEINVTFTGLPEGAAWAVAYNGY